jgi:glutathione peroxidase
MKAIYLILIVMINLQINAQSFYDLEAVTIDGEVLKFETLKGKKVMIVNVASKCGYTPQYEDLEKLWQNYKDKNFVIIGFPANDFMKQEPGTNEEIKSFCSINYGVSFPMMSKISVIGGDMHPVYQWLTDKVKNGVSDSKVKWNFQKYLIDENGRLLGYFEPGVKPLDPKIIEMIE